MNSSLPLERAAQSCEAVITSLGIFTSIADAKAKAKSNPDAPESAAISDHIAMILEAQAHLMIAFGEAAEA